MEDNLGDRMKLYEGMESDRRFMPRLPVMARLDGKNFSTFTRGLERPYDVRLSRLMADTTRKLVELTQANVGYCQSDEISLTWYHENYDSEIYFSGRVQKICSVLAAECSVLFNQGTSVFGEFMAGKKSPVFDCRAWVVPSLVEAANVFLWRELDATKNAISMAAQQYYSHTELMLRSGKVKQEMLFAKGVNFNDYPDFFKRGTWVRKKTVMRKMTAEDLLNLPEKHHARRQPEMEFERTVIEELKMPPFSRVTNRVGVIFHGEDPQVENGEES